MWADWLKDPDGMLTIAEFGGVIVGLGKLTLLAPGQWWQEGLRVHPEYQGRGIASHLHKYQLDYWTKYGNGILRLVTNSQRKAVHHLCELFGYAKTAEFTYFRAQALLEPIPYFHLLELEQVSAALEFVDPNTSQSESMSFSHGLLDLGWKKAAPTLQFLEDAVRAGHAWWWQARQGLLTVWIDVDDDGTHTPTIQLLACSIDQIENILVDFRRLAASLGYAQAAWVAPLHPALLPILEAAGFTRQWDDSLYLYEKHHPTQLMV